jgi:predicted NBD/HSP70 family sugar kinase
MTKKKYILGIDVGGTTIKYGLVTPQGKLIKSEQTFTPKTKVGIINQLIKIIKNKGKKISKVGIGVPGLLDIKTGTIFKTPNLPLSHTPLLSFLKKKIRLLIKIDNDANCFTLAEAMIGAGKKYQNVAGLTLGTGIGGGIVINKKIYHGRSNAGELGHQYLDWRKAKDLEDLTGAGKLKLSGQAYQKLEQAALAKNLRALEFWKRLGTILGFACLNYINILDPDIIILGGKQARAFRFFYPTMIKIIKQYCLFQPPKIVKSKLIDKGGIIGAALLFKNSKS